MTTELRDASNWNVPTRVPYSGMHTFTTGTSTAQTPASNLVLPLADTDIFNANNIGFYGAGSATGAGSQARAVAIRDWLTDPTHGEFRVLYASIEHSFASSGTGGANPAARDFGEMLLREFDPAFTLVGHTGVATSNQGWRDGPFRVPTNRNADSNALMNFIFRDGPFTDGNTDISGAIALVSQDGDGSTMTNHPNTFIPLIVNYGSNAQVRMGIDPVLRIVYIGENEMFGTYGTILGRPGTAAANNVNNWNWGTLRPAGYQTQNTAFIRNVAAWMIGVAQFGNEFTEYINELATARGITELIPIPPMP